MENKGNGARSKAQTSRATSLRFSVSMNNGGLISRCCFWGINSSFCGESKFLSFKRPIKSDQLKKPSYRTKQSQKSFSTKKLSTDDIELLQNEILSALKLSAEHVENCKSALEFDAKIEIVWRAYAATELAIGLSRLAFKDQIGLGLGSLRKLPKVSKKTGDARIASNLSEALVKLERARSQFSLGRATDGLESARQARDHLKLILLGERSRKGI